MIYGYFVDFVLIRLLFKLFLRQPLLRSKQLKRISYWNWDKQLFRWGNEVVTVKTACDWWFDIVCGSYLYFWTWFSDMCANRAQMVHMAIATGIHDIWEGEHLKILWSKHFSSIELTLIGIVMSSGNRNVKLMSLILSPCLAASARDGSALENWKDWRMEKKVSLSHTYGNSRNHFLFPSVVLFQSSPTQS